ncbi:hypothetical protein Tco_1156741 [Tanacetum coccineum]
MFKVFNQCLTSRTSGHDQTQINILQIFHTVVNHVHVDYASLLCFPLMIDDDSGNRIEPESNKENPKTVDDDDDDENEKEKQDDYNDDYAIHKNVDNVFHDVIPKIASNATNDIIENNFPKVLVEAIMKERDTFQETIKRVFKIKLMIQKKLGWEVSVLKQSTDHDDHQEDDSPSEREKREKRRRTSKRSKSARGSSKQPAQRSETYVSKRQQKQQEWDTWVEELVSDVDEHVPTVYDHERMEATLRDMMSNQFRNAEEYAYHLEQSMNYMENQINGNTEEESYILSLHKIHDVPFPEDDLEEKMKRWIIVTSKNDKPDRFSETDFKYLNKNDIEYLYNLCRNKKVDYRETKLLNSLMTFIKSCVIWERFHDFQSGIENYQIRVNLTAPMLTFPDIKACDPYFIVDKPSIGLIYLNIKNEKRVMYFVEIVKFCDAMLERVLNEVKLKIFETEFLKKAPLLGDLNLDIMKAYERKITNRLRHREQMRRWECFVNGRPILSMMWRQ